MPILRVDESSYISLELHPAALLLASKEGYEPEKEMHKSVNVPINENFVFGSYLILNLRSTPS